MCKNTTEKATKQQQAKEKQQEAENNDKKESSSSKINKESEEIMSKSKPNATPPSPPALKARRGKRVKSQDYTPPSRLLKQETEASQFVKRKPKKQSKAKQKHGADGPSGGMEALVPSLIGVAILVCAIMAKMGFRGRAQVAGIDLGTTNSVICVQQPSKGVGVIDCIQDPATQSPIIPSVVSFLEPSERPVGAKTKVKSNLNPHPSQVIVGAAAKKRIDSHPHHTLYNAKRVLGRPPTDRAIQQLKKEVEFDISIMSEDLAEDPINEDQRVVFRVPHHTHSNQPSEWMSIAPQQVGSYVVHALLQLTHQQLGHENVNAAVICVPAKFDTLQRQHTVAAFKEAGVTVTRIIEEPTAAALAYGLHQKDGVDYIVVYDFGGGTLDISLLHVSNGFVDVMGSDGDDRLGGADFDAAIAHHWLQQDGKQEAVAAVSSVLHQLSDQLEETKHLDLEQELSSHCPNLKEHPLCTVSSFHTLGEQLKIQLSDTFFDDKNADETDALQAKCLHLPKGMSEIPHDDDSLKMVDTFCESLVELTLTLTRDEYQQAAQPLLERSIEPVQRLLKDLNLKTNEIDEVVMVGGTTRMPQIRALVREALPESQLNTHIDPDITVAYGAASVID